MKPHLEVCERCEVAKPATETYFGLNLRTKDRLKPYCRACSPTVAAERRKRKSEKGREWAAANREKVRKINRRTYENNREARLAYMRRWRVQNRERINEYQRAYAERKRQEFPQSTQ